MQFFFVRECHHCISNCSHRCLTSQPFATQQLSTHFSISLEKNVCFCSFEPKIKNQCWSLEAVCGRLVNISKSTAMLLEPKCDQVALWRRRATAASPRPLRTRGLRTSAPPAGEAARGRPPSPWSLREVKNTTGWSTVNSCASVALRIVQNLNIAIKKLVTEKPKLWKISQISLKGFSDLSI